MNRPLSVELVEFVENGGRIFGRYSELYNKGTKGTGLHAHHLIEKRFAKALKIKESKMMAVSLTVPQHEVYTEMWRKAVPRGIDYNIYSTPSGRKKLLKIAKKVYKDEPKLYKALVNSRDCANKPRIPLR
jgi:hypothetical protein